MDQSAWPADAGTPGVATVPRQRSRTDGQLFLRTFLTALLAAVLASAGTLGFTLTAIVPGLIPSQAPTQAPASVGPSRMIVDESDLTAMVATTRRSVVTITAQITATRVGPFGGTYGVTGVGSGVIVTADGYILTNRHVVEGATSLTVALADNTEYPGSVVAISDSDDLALVRIQATGLPTATIGDSTLVAVGQTAIAIGSPLGEYTQTVTRGIVSATGRDIEVRDSTTRTVVTLKDLIQTDAAINEGNSGGPLLDAAGQVIGINTAMASSSEGLGFATPINAAAALLDRAGL
jgi:S1-C subfamily serine protease